MKPILATIAPPGPAHAAGAGAGGWTLTRARFAMAADAFNPGIGATYVLPFSTTSYDDRDVTLNDDQRATAALVVTAKPTGQGRLRVSIFNPSIAAGVAVPAGMLQVVAMSAVNTRGESADAWTVLQSTTESFDAGDVVYAVFRSKSAGDFLQASESTFLQVERWA